MIFPRKFYLRKEPLKQDTTAQHAIRHGLWEQGVETVDFTDPAEIQTFDDLGPDVGVAGYISDVLTALQHMGKPLPVVLDYPDELKPYYDRIIQRRTLGEVRKPDFWWKDYFHVQEQMGDQWVPVQEPVFVKPALDHKLFTGMVWRRTDEQRLLLAPLPDSLEVWASQVVPFVSEYRVFVLNDQILDCRRYKGNWALAPARGVVEDCVQRLKGNAPVAYCLDVGVTEYIHGRKKIHNTSVVELNDGFAFGPYGLLPAQYACMIAARWREMTK